MFDKKCSKCKSKIKKNFDFCPYCGNNASSLRDMNEYGMLGKNDFTSIPAPFGNSIIEKMLNQTMKMLEKQMKSMNQNTNQERKNPISNTATNTAPNMSFQFFINGKRIFPSVQQDMNSANPINKNQKKVKAIKMPQEKLEMFAKLPKKEPNARFRRLGNKLIYELEVPGVNDLDDILINKLENSIEIKALGDNTTYSKILNINLPILRYGLDNGNLIIELQGN